MKKSGAKNGNGNGSELSYEQLKDLFAQVAKAQAELAEAQARTNKQIDRVDKQLGDLGIKWGTFTEGLAFPSIARLFDEHFGIPSALV